MTGSKAPVYVAVSVALLAIALCWRYAARSGDRPTPYDPGAVRQKIAALPLYFERNVGQTDPQVQFLSRAGALNLFLTGTETVLVLGAGGAAQRAPDLQATLEGKSAASARESAVLRISPLGANPNPQIEGIDPLPGHVNYLIGDVPSNWRMNVATYGRVRYRSIYPGVDLVYYGSRAALEYDLIVAPGADPGRIALAIDGAGDASLDASGDLILGTASGYVTMRKPRIYQQDTRHQGDGIRREIEGRYALTDLPGGSRKKMVAIQVAGYDRTLPLVIDPQFVYSTCLGGNGSNKLETPESFASFFGVQPSSMPTNFNFSDYAFDIALDPQGNIYVAGVADSPDFPTLNAEQSTDNTSTNTPNAFVAKLNPYRSGSASLVYATYLGGSGNAASGGTEGDEAHGIAVDGSGDAYIAGLTYSQNFPHTAVAFETQNNAPAANINNGFVTELNFSGGLVYSTFINGSQGAAASRIAVKPGCLSNCAAYVSGSTTSTDFPTLNPYQTVNPDTHSNPAAYLLVLNGGGSSLMYSTYFGGSGTRDGGEGALGVTVDSAGHAYVTGFTYSTDLPTQNPYQLHSQNTFSDSSAFVAEFDPSQNGSNSLVYSTYLGGNGGLVAGDIGTNLTLDQSGHIFVTGTTYSSIFPVTANAYQSSNLAASGFGSNAFVSELDPSMAGSAQLAYSTYLGGSGFPYIFNPIIVVQADAAAGIAVDAAGRIFVSGGTFSSDFPTSAGACQQQNNANQDVNPDAGGGTNAFLTEIDPSQSGNSQLVFSGYLGGSTLDMAGSIRLDSSDDVFVAGTTVSSDFPVTIAGYQQQNNTGTNASSNVFIAELDPSSANCTLNSTPAPTATPTPRPTASASPTPVRTPSPTPVATASTTPTAAPTQSPTATPLRSSPTPVESATPSSMPSPSPTPARAATQTPSATPAATSTSTMTPAPTSAGGATPTPTGVGAHTPTATPGGGPTPISSQTPGSGPTPTGQGSQSVTPTPASSGGGTPSPGASQSSTPTPTPTAVPVFTPGGKLSKLPLTVSFGSLGTDKSSTHKLKITNSGAGTLSGIVDASELTPPFSVPSSALSFSLKRNHSQSIAIEFAPTTPQSAARQSYTGTLNILTSDPKLPNAIAVAVKGIGVTGNLVVQKALGFGKVADGKKKTATLLIKNTGMGVLHVAIGDSSTAEFSVVSPSSPFALADGKSQAVKIQFAPDAKQTFVGLLPILSDDPAHGQAVVTLKGIGG